MKCTKLHHLSTCLYSTSISDVWYVHTSRKKQDKMHLNPWWCNNYQEIAQIPEHLYYNYIECSIFSLNWILILCCHFKSCSSSVKGSVEGWEGKYNSDPVKRKYKEGWGLDLVFGWLTLTPTNASGAVSASSPSLAQCVSLCALYCEEESEIRPCMRSQPLSLFLCVSLQLLWVLESKASSVRQSDSEKLSKADIQESGTREEREKERESKVGSLRFFGEY